MKAIKRFFSVFSIFMVLAVASVSGWVYAQYHTLTQNDAEQIIEIPRGTSFRGAADRLAEEGIYPNANFLYYWARLTEQTSVRAGEYSVPPEITLAELLTLLASGRTVQHRITLVEGWQFTQWRKALAKLENINHQLPDMTDEDVAVALGLDHSIPEGLLFPDTYSYTRGDSDLSILRQARDRMAQVLADAWAEKSENSIVSTPYEALVLASIIERETGAPWERENISGVFTRRLRRGMRLQTDPTVIYGMGEAYDGRIRRSDLNRRTAYNTYRINGLPPTPIAMPGRDAVLAALNPADGNALYFVARGDGTHEFSATLREHNSAVRNYQLQRSEDYRSNPPAVQTMPEGADE